MPSDVRADDLLLSAHGRSGVNYIIIGGFAVGVHGFARASKDLDIVPEPAPENLERLARSLAMMDAQHVGVGDFDRLRSSPMTATDPVQLAEGANFRLDD